MAQELLKQANLLSILELLRSRQEASQNEIAATLGLQRSTVSNLARELRGRGWLQEVGKRRPSKNGGKPRVLLSLDTSAAGIVGFTIRRDHLRCHRFDLLGSILHTSRHDIDESRPEKAIQIIRSEVRRASRLEPPPRACGIAVSSVVRAEGDIEDSTDFPWDIPDFRARVAAALPEGLPLLIENDANCVALHALGQLTDTKAPTMIALYLSLDPPSLGSGIIVDGRLVRGARGAAGEVMRVGAGDLIDSTWNGVCAAMGLLDPGLVVIAGDEEAGPALADIERRLDKTFPAVARKTLFGPDLPAQGIAYLASAHILHGIVRGNGDGNGDEASGHFKETT